MRSYETVILVDAKLDAESLDAELQKMVDYAKNLGATNLKIKKWGRKELAYVLSQHDWAYFNSIEFDAEGDTANVFGAWLKLHDLIIKFQTHRAEEKRAELAQ